MLTNVVVFDRLSVSQKLSVLKKVTNPIETSRNATCPVVMLTSSSGAVSRSNGFCDSATYSTMLMTSCSSLAILVLLCSAWFLAVVCLLFWHISLRTSAYCAVMCLVAIQRVRAPFRKVNPMTPPWLFPLRYIVCSSAWSVATALNRLEDSRTTNPPSRRYW